MIAYTGAKGLPWVLIGSKDLRVVLHRSRLFASLRFGQGREGGNKKIPVIGVLLFEVVFWFHLWIAVFEAHR